MEIMSAAVLDRIRDRCEAEWYYRACIFCEDRARARVIQETLINAWPATEGSHRLSGFDVRFPATGSFVRILTSGEVGSGSARGNRFHEICIDLEVIQITEQIRNALNRMVVPYQRVDYRFTPYADEPCFEHLDTRESFARGRRAEALVVDEFADIQGSFGQWWNETGQYEFSIDGDMITLKNKEAPDFGEISPSQELNDFVETLAQGK